MARSQQTARKGKVAKKGQSVKPVRSGLLPGSNRNQYGGTATAKVTATTAAPRKSFGLTDAEKSAIQIMDQRFLELLESSATFSLGKGKEFLMMDRVAGLYETTFHVPLDPAELGHENLKALVRTLPSITTYRMGCYGISVYEFIGRSFPKPAIVKKAGPKQETKNRFGGNLLARSVVADQTVGVFYPVAFIDRGELTTASAGTGKKSETGTEMDSKPEAVATGASNLILPTNSTDDTVAADGSNQDDTSDPEDMTELEQRAERRALGRAKRKNKKADKEEKKAQEMRVAQAFGQYFPTTPEYQELTKCLTDNPEGVTWIEIRKALPDLLGFIQAYGKEHEVALLQPPVALRQCKNLRFTERIRDATGAFFVVP